MVSTLASQGWPVLTWTLSMMVDPKPMRMRPPSTQPKWPVTGPMHEMMAPTRMKTLQMMDALLVGLLDRLGRGKVRTRWRRSSRCRSRRGWAGWY